MKTAIIGSRNIVNIDFTKINTPITEIISGGAKGVDTLAKNYAINNNINLIEIKPDYKKHHFKQAPLLRNIEIVNKSDIVYAFWDGVSKGTLFVINYCKKIGKPINVILS